MRLANVLLLGVVVMAGSGCGFTHDYVLKEPLKVKFDGSEETVVLPAGTHVRQTFYKVGYDFIEVQGGTTQGLRQSSQP